MADNMRIGAGLELSGEADFKRAVAGINKDLTVLGSEMGKVTAQFGSNANSMEALTAKADVYNKQIEEQKKKIDLIRAALESASREYGENSNQVKEWQIKLNNAEAQLARTENALSQTTEQIDNFGNETDETGGSLEKASKQADDSGGRFSNLGEILKGVGVAMGAVAVAAGAVAIKLGKDVLEAFGELEQNLGGSEAVFGEYAAAIQKTGEEAYKNLGVSQSEYLATANKMGALFQGSGIEQQESLDLTEKAMQRAADMASVMGIDMSSAMEAVTGAAKGNYTMMDNLGVKMDDTSVKAFAVANGFKGVWAQASNAEKSQYAMQMFFDGTSQYAGNFAREATQTVTGSIGLLKAAWGSFIAGLGNTNADITNLTENVVDAFRAVVKNIVPVVQNLTNALPSVFGALLEGVGELLPGLISTATNLFQQALQTFVALLPLLIPAVVQMLITIVTAIVDNLPLIVDAALLLIITLANGIADALPELVPKIVETVLTIVETLVDNIDLIVDAAIVLIGALAEGLIKALPILIEKTPVIIIKLVEAIAENLPKIIEAGIGIIATLGLALIEAIPQLVEKIPEIIVAVVDAFGELQDKMKDIGAKVVTGIWDGISGAAGWLKEQVAGFVGGIVSAFTGKDGIDAHSPSRLFAKFGGWMAQGLGEGFTSSMSGIAAEMENVIPTNFDSRIQYAVKQTTEPSTTQAMEGAVNGLAAIMGNQPQGGNYTINLVLPNGTKLAEVLFDPLRNVARQKGVAFGG